MRLGKEQSVGVIEERDAGRAAPDIESRVDQRLEAGYESPDGPGEGVLLPSA